jgi:hypothetical protein
VSIRLFEASKGVIEAKVRVQKEKAQTRVRERMKKT